MRVVTNNQLMSFRRDWHHFHREPQRSSGVMWLRSFSWLLSSSTPVGHKREQQRIYAGGKTKSKQWITNTYVL